MGTAEGHEAIPGGDCDDCRRILEDAVIGHRRMPDVGALDPRHVASGAVGPIGVMIGSQRAVALQALVTVIAGASGGFRLHVRVMTREA